MDILKYTTETRLYSKNNEDIIAYFDEVKEQYNYILRKVYYTIRNNPKIKENFLNTELQSEYNISRRTANSIMKTVHGRINSIKRLKETEVKQNQYRLERISAKLEKLIPMLSDLKLKAKENNIKDLVKYKNLKTKVAFLKIRKDKLINKIKSLNHQLETNKFKITFGTKKLLKQSLEEFLNKRDNQMIFLGSKEEPCCNQTFQLKYVPKINQFIIKVRKDFKYKDAKGEERYVYGKCFFNNHKKLLKEILKTKNSPLTYQIIQRNNKYYLQCTFEINNCNLSVTDNAQGVIGIDFNKGFVTLLETNRYGHLVQTQFLPYRFKSGNKTKTDLQKIANHVTALACQTGKNVCIENLDFKTKRSKIETTETRQGKQYNDMIHSLAYRQFIDIIESAAYRNKVTLIKVNPAWTSWLAKKLYCPTMKLNVHVGASYVIARRGQGYKDTVKSL